MPAYNARFRPTEVAGIPVLTAALFIVAVIGIVFAMLPLPTSVRFVAGGAAVLSLTLGLFVAIQGDELPFVLTKFTAFMERHGYTAETNVSE